MPGEGNDVNKGDQRAGWVGGAEKESIEWGSVWDLLEVSLEREISSR